MAPEGDLTQAHMMLADQTITWLRDLNRAAETAAH